jgi:hypothetical protein
MRSATTGIIANELSVPARMNVSVMPPRGRARPFLNRPLSAWLPISVTTSRPSLTMQTELFGLPRTVRSRSNRSCRARLVSPPPDAITLPVSIE